MFIRSIQRTARVIWNMRISYPNEPIYICDNNASNAFRLVKIHPTLVGMHCFKVNNKYLGFCTGMIFSNNCSPTNFDIFAVGEYQRRVNAHLDLTKHTERTLMQFLTSQNISLHSSRSTPVAAQFYLNTSTTGKVRQKHTIYNIRKHSSTFLTSTKRCSQPRYV